ncbi:MAG: hypothetical protein ACFFCZ_28565 [Promethearchaeota archaeon]
MGTNSQKFKFITHILILATLTISFNLVIVSSSIDFIEIEDQTSPFVVRTDINGFKKLLDSKKLQMSSSVFIPNIENDLIKNNTTDIMRSTFSPPSGSTETIVVLVNSTLYSSSSNIQSSIATYVKDLTDTGYTTILHTSTVANASVLRGLLQNWYFTYNISGAVLIGSFPHALFYHPINGEFSADIFICDLYLMDLDGNWWDLENIDGVFDKHNASLGADIYPEIYVGRIDATNFFINGLNNEENILNLLSRLHSYRTGGVARTHRAIAYIDDDWQPLANIWSGWLDDVYPTHTAIHTPTTWTNASDWLNNRLSQDYEWAHLCVHSSVTGHFFGPSGSGEGTASSMQITNVPPSFNFYNLFACHAAQWTSANCLATTYLFSGSYSLAVVGSTKSGGMLGGSYFYDPLGQNKTIGQGFHDWFQYITTYTSYYLEWFYGMCILGDPFLTSHYDCTVLPVSIFSSTHPDPAQTYDNMQPQFNWTIPADVNGITGYYYILDQNPTTVPTSVTGTYTSVNGTQPSSPLTDGTWYLHVVAVDGTGNVGKTAAHYQVNIETKPIINLSSPVNASIVQSGILIDLIITGQNLSYILYHWDNDANTTLSSPYEIILSKPDGLHILYIYANNTLGNWTSETFVFTVDDTPPMIILNDPANLSICQFGDIISLEVSDTVSLSQVLYNWNNGSNNTLSAPYTVILPSEAGQHLLRVYARDRAGNWARINFVFTIEAFTPFNTNSTSTTTFFTTESSTTTNTSLTIDFFTFEIFLAVFTLLAVFLRKQKNKKGNTD